eukprot:TRINITY_DN4434_c0_g2_i1.p1 TRINITY_DN4434_c0_g2~~TRINITY_DN4434_c0_g2_i1.p1  ORF type:complete len:211 (-),score=53.54 TRINITY_DN4434_c0_g2_i1:50-682(-)
MFGGTEESIKELEKFEKNFETLQSYLKHIVELIADQNPSEEIATKIRTVNCEIDALKKLQAVRISTESNNVPPAILPFSDNNYQLVSSEVYDATHHTPDKLLNMRDEEGLGVKDPGWILFTFPNPRRINGMVIGNNYKVPEGWNFNHLVGASLSINKGSGLEVLFENLSAVGAGEWLNNPHSALLVPIEMDNVHAVQLSGYFSTSFVTFV